MPLSNDVGTLPSQLGWWSPDPRGVIRPEGLRVSRSLARSERRFETTINSCFSTVVHACGDAERPHGWITQEIAAAYGELHRLGFAHSVEVWKEGDLVGGLYGVELGGLFAGESMFHRVADASKVALVSLVRRLSAASGPRLIDCQWVTPHLASMGAITMSRDDYLSALPALIANSAVLGRP